MTQIDDGDGTFVGNAIEESTQIGRITGRGALPTLEKQPEPTDWGLKIRQSGPSKTLQSAPSEHLPSGAERENWPDFVNYLP